MSKRKDGYAQKHQGRKKLFNQTVHKNNNKNVTPLRELGEVFMCSGKKSVQYALVLAVVLPILSGCVMAPVLVGGAAVTTATMMTDRRTTGTIVSDKVLEQRVLYEISQALGEQIKTHITVTGYEGRVLLTGEVPTTNARRVAEQVASASQDVISVINELAVMDNSSMTTRLADSMLATKVRTAILGTERLSLNQMKVTVDRGNVYLMGVVTRSEARLAANVAKDISGVQKVVTCFSVISEAEVAERLKNLKRAENAQHEEGRN